MKKSILSAIVMVLFTLSGLRAQENTTVNQVIEQYKVQVTAGSGFYSGGMPVYAFADFTVHPHWTVGPQIDFVFFDNFHFVLSGRGDYHFTKLLNLDSAWDVYAGANMGIDFSRHTSFSAGIHAGGRWYWNDSWGLNAEIGGGTFFNAKLGVTVRL
jgi:outer membrane immunogenic protein